MKAMKKILIWLLTVFLLLGGLVYLPHICGILLLAAALLMMPVEKWQTKLKKLMRGGVWVAITAILMIAGFAMVPQQELPDQSMGGFTTGYTDVSTSTTCTAAPESSAPCPSTTESDGTKPMPSNPATTEPAATEPVGPQPPATERPTTKPPASGSTDAEPPTTVPQASVHQHEWSEASCTKPAICNSCGETKGTTKDHQWVSATCTAPQYCVDCGKSKGEAYGHSYENGVCIFCGIKVETTEEMVWIPTNGGKKYHTKETCSNMENPRCVTISEAEALGFTPCKRCH